MNKCLFQTRSWREELRRIAENVVLVKLWHILSGWLSVLSVALLVALFVVFPAFGADESTSGVYSFIVENDLFNNSDRHYTNGVRLDWSPGTTSTPDWALVIARQVPLFPKEGVVRHGYSFGQSMFTPRDITIVNPPTDDRPYAGWLYGTIGMGVETERQLDQFALTLGMVGPVSLAEQGQKIMHKILVSDKPRGWDTQLRNEPGIVVTYQRSWRALVTKTLLGNDLDLTPHMGGALGNVYTYANTGLTMRYGKSLPLDYGPPRIQPSIPGSSYIVSTGGFKWYLFAGFECRAVARNIFLDGNSFRGGRSVDKEPLVGDLQFGSVLTWQAMLLSYTHVLRTREFESQRERDGFGAISLSVSY